MNLNAAISKKEAEGLPFLLVNPGPFQQTYTNLPQGLAILGAILQKNNIPVYARDYTAQPFDRKELYDLIRKNGIKVAGFTFMTPQAPWAYDLTGMLRRDFPHLTLICGGAHPTFVPAEPLENGFDIVFRREAEETLVNILPLFVRGDYHPEALGNIRGITYLEGVKMANTGMSGRIRNLDEIPFPARHLFPFPQNYMPQIPLCPGACAQFFTSRGCPEFCTFCAQPYRDGYYFRSPENVVEEIESVKKQFNISHFYINDDNFCYDNKRAIDISELMIHRRVNMPWAASFARVEPVCFEMFHAMKRSGCMAITFGVESGDPDIRNAIRKKGTLDDAIKAVALAKRAGLIVGATFVLGHPTETVEQANRSIQFAKKLNADYTKFFINTPYPGSADYKYFKRNNLLTAQSWADYWIQSQPIIKTRHMSTEELFSLRFKAFIHFYTNPRWWFRQAFNLFRIRNAGLGARIVRNLFMEAIARGLAPSRDSLRPLNDGISSECLQLLPSEKSNG
ncbi:MAG: radical SAM protein [Candidatus Tectomicrobia bacterium]|nr:radical SAM protein [Candidatus Tectomicrobia bacterium]